jgi:hypothetical protein
MYEAVPIIFHRLASGVSDATGTVQRSPDITPANQSAAQLARILGQVTLLRRLNQFGFLPSTAAPDEIPATGAPLTRRCLL